MDILQDDHVFRSSLPFKKDQLPCEPLSHLALVVHIVDQLWLEFRHIFGVFFYNNLNVPEVHWLFLSKKLFLCTV